MEDQNIIMDSKLLEILKEKFPFYVSGKRSRTLEAAIYYIQHPNLTSRQVSQKFNMTHGDTKIRNRATEIMRLFDPNFPGFNILKRSRYCSFCNQHLEKGEGFEVYSRKKTRTQFKPHKIVGHICHKCWKTFTKEKKE